MSVTLLGIPVIYSDEFSTITNLAVRNLVAPIEEGTGVLQSIYIGASSNVTIQAQYDLNFELGLSDTMNIVSNNKLNAVTISSIPTTTAFTTTNKDLTLTTTDNTLYKVNVGAASFSESNNYQQFETSKPLGLIMNNSLVVHGGEVITGSCAVGGNLTVGSNLFTQKMNIFKPASNNTMVGFGLNINDKDQLEIIKFTTFENGSNVSKKIAMFGNTRLNSNDVSDSTYTDYENAANYTVSNFELINQLSAQMPKLIHTSNVADMAITQSKLGIDIGKWNVLGSNIWFSDNDTSGSVGIGTDTPAYKLQVIGEVFSTGNVLTSSDQRLKENIKFIPNALEKLLSIRGYTFTRTDDKKDYAGVLAQEVAQVLPEVVSTTADGYQSVAYGNLVALTIEAIHELYNLFRSGTLASR
jgi:hypothetical protein